jgi:hypothetical protein
MKIDKRDLGPNANLRCAVLRNANLYGVNLRCANLYGADLNRAILHRTCLAGTDLRGANLEGADLSYADLRGANLRGASLNNANLYNAVVCGADLDDTALLSTNLFAARLEDTCLDPHNEPNAATKGFRSRDGFVIGYRTRRAAHVGEYTDGRIYAADWFSTSDRECHPGLYLWPTIKQALRWAKVAPLIRVRTHKRDVHKAGDKWRCRWFEVLGRAG